MDSKIQTRQMCHIWQLFVAYHKHFFCETVFYFFNCEVNSPDNLNYHSPLFPLSTGSSTWCFFSTFSSFYFPKPKLSVSETGLDTSFFFIFSRVQALPAHHVERKVHLFSGGRSAGEHHQGVSPHCLLITIISPPPQWVPSSASPCFGIFCSVCISSFPWTQLDRNVSEKEESIHKQEKTKISKDTKATNILLPWKFINWKKGVMLEFIFKICITRFSHQNNFLWWY